MPLIQSPLGLSQGGITAVSDAVFGTPTGPTVTITSAGAELPAITSGDYFEVRDHSNPANNGLYLSSGSPTTGSITGTKQALTGTVVNPVAAGAEAIRTLGTNADEKNVYFDTTPDVNNIRRFTFLNGFGSVTVLDQFGVVGQDMYSFFKEEWKNDNDLIKFPFPMTAITPEQFEFNGWKPVDEGDAGNTISTTDPSNTRQLFRTMGWDEVDANGFLEDSYFCWLTLGNIDSTDKDTGDRPYYFFGSQAAASPAVFAGPANEGVQQVQRVDLSGAGTIAFVDGGVGNDSFTRTTGSFVTDGFLVGDNLLIQNAEDAANNGSFPILAVSATSIEVATGTFTANAADTTAIAAIDRREAGFTTRIRVFGKTYDQSTTGDIGVSILTNQVYRFPLSEGPDNVITDLAGGTDQTSIDNLFDDIITVPVAPYNDMAVGYFSAAQTRSGFNALAGDTPSPGDAQFGVIIEADSGGAVGGPPIAEEIYAFTQALLVQTSNINDPNARITGEAAITVVGQLAEPLTALASTGNTLSTLFQVANPAGAANGGVAIDNFDTNDTNRISQRDNDNDARTFPFVAAGTINFNANLSTDVDAIYRMFFTNDDAGSNLGRDFGTIDAITVDDNLGADIAGAVPQNPGGSSVAWDFDYDGNVQRGNGAPVDAPITIVAIGLSAAQYVVATGTITRNVGQTFSLVAALERNYSAT